jgi:hypothetical protein
MRYQIRVDPLWRPLLLIGGVMQRTAYVEVSAESVRFRFGYVSETLSRDEIAGVSAFKPALLAGIGVRWWPGTVSLYGSQRGAVRIDLKNSHRIRILPLLPRIVPVRRINVALVDPEAFVAVFAAA